MDLPAQWQDAIRRDLVDKPALPDPAPERRLARLLAAYVVSGLLFLLLPGTLLGVWNLVGISSQRQLNSVPAAWIQAHGHAQFFGWVGSFMIGISLYTLPKFRGTVCRSIPLGWAMWAMWSAGVALRPFAYRVAAGLELAVALLLVWQVTAPSPKPHRHQPWETPIFTGFASLVALLVWQVVRVPPPLFITLAIWMFAFPVVAGYSAKFFPGLIGTPPPHAAGLRAAMALLALAAFGLPLASVALACWSLRVFHRPAGTPKTAGVYRRYPIFARLAYAWLVISALLGFGVSRPGVLGASRHAFTVGFLATLIFAIGPRILPSFLNSRELWSARVMQWSLLLLTAGCALRVISEPLAYGNIMPAAWNVLPVSAFLELTAVMLFGLNLAMSLATPIPAWFGRKHVNDRMSLYWLITSYPATRRLLIEDGLTTLARADLVPKSLSLRDAAQADGVAPELLVEKLGAFFESRLARSLRHPLRTSESMRSTNR